MNKNTGFKISILGPDEYPIISYFMSTRYKTYFLTLTSFYIIISSPNKYLQHLLYQ